jgi:hypothetical protein
VSKLLPSSLRSFATFWLGMFSEEYGVNDHKCDS